MKEGRRTIHWVSVYLKQEIYFYLVTVFRFTIFLVCYIFKYNSVYQINIISL